MTRTLIEDGIVLTVNQDQEVFDRGYLLIEGDRISDVAAGTPSAEIRGQADEVIDASDSLVMPGMVNAHVHFGDAFIRGLDDDRPLLGWLEEAAFPIYRHLNAEEARVGALMGAVDNIRGGATAVIDNVLIPNDSAGFDASFEAAAETGIRYNLVRGFVECGYSQEDLWEDFETVLSDVQRLHSTWHGKQNGRLRLGFGPVVPWGITAENIVRCAELAQDLGIGIHTHTAESEEEVQLTVEAYGMRPLEWFASLGVLGPNFQNAHSVWLDDNEIEQMAASRAAVVHNPVSNGFTSTGGCANPQVACRWCARRLRHGRPSSEPRPGDA